MTDSELIKLWKDKEIFLPMFEKASQDHSDNILVLEAEVVSCKKGLDDLNNLIRNIKKN